MASAIEDERWGSHQTAAPGGTYSVNGAIVDLATYEVTGPVLILLQAPDGTTRHIQLDPWARHDAVRPVGGANVLDPDVVVF